MKKSVILALVLLINGQMLLGQGKSTGETKDSVKLHQQELDSLKNVITNLTKQVTDLKNKSEVQIVCSKQNLSWKKELFIISPILLLILYTILFISGLYNLNEPAQKSFLSVMITEDDNKSIVPGKFIAFICGMTAVIISLIATSYYGYMLIAECKGSFNLDDLWKIVLSLGIGIVPYGINVYKKNEKEGNENINNPSNPQS